MNDNRNYDTVSCGIGFYHRTSQAPGWRIICPAAGAFKENIKQDAVFKNWAVECYVQGK